MTLFHRSQDLDDLYDNAPCGYVSTTVDGVVVGANATVGRWLGIEPDSLLGKRFTDMLTDESRRHHDEYFAPMLAETGELKGISLDLAAVDGTPVPVYVTANMKFDDDGNVERIRITVQDESARRDFERELLEARRLAEVERVRAQALATTLQKSLMPPSIVPPRGLEAGAYYHFASSYDVGGDFYDLFEISDDRWGFFLGDVSGKGPSAAAVTSLTRYALRAAAVWMVDPVQVLHNLDTVLSNEYPGDDRHFCTVLFGTLTRRGTEFDVELASGGHPPALLFTADGTADYVDTIGGQMVGMLRDARFRSVTFTLRPGDTLVLYSDGLTEARTGVGTARYDDDGALLNFAAQHTPTTAPQIVGALRGVIDGFGDGLQDDVALLAIGVPR